MKIDSKSLIFGILTGIAIGCVLSFVLTKSLPFGLTPTEQYTITMKLKSEFIWYLQQNKTSYPFGVTAVFLRGNTTIGEYQIWYSPATNITQQKGDYTVKIYEGKFGLYIKTLQIYVAKNIQIEV